MTISFFEFPFLIGTVRTLQRKEVKDVLTPFPFLIGTVRTIEKAIQNYTSKIGFHSS